MPDEEEDFRSPIRVAVQGTGNWGRNLVRALSSVNGVSVDWIVDTDPRALTAASEIAPRAAAVRHLEETSFLFDAAVIATPAADHVSHAALLLQHQKHVLVEKPAAMRVEDAAALCRIAAEQGRTLMVGHQLCFHPAFQQLKRCVDAGMIGEPTHLHSIRTGPVDLAKEPGVIWSYGPHDISMMLALCGTAPDKIHADVQYNSTDQAVEANLTFDFKTGLQAKIRLARRPMEKNRRFTVRGERGTLLFEDGAAGARLYFGSTVGTTKEIPFAPAPDALQSSLSHFAACIRSYHPPRTGPSHLSKVTGILLDCEKHSPRPLG